MKANSKSANLTVKGALKHVWVSSAGHFYECGPAAERVFRNHAADVVSLSVSKAELSLV